MVSVVSAHSTTQGGSSASSPACTLTLERVSGSTSHMALVAIAWFWAAGWPNWRCTASCLRDRVIGDVRWDLGIVVGSGGRRGWNLEVCVSSASIQCAAREKGPPQMVRQVRRLPLLWPCASAQPRRQETPGA